MQNLQSGLVVTMPETAKFETRQYDGYERWRLWDAGKDAYFYVHRLTAIAEYGIDAVKGMHVHHRNRIPWDNRPENLELLPPDRHCIRHHCDTVKSVSD